jgi:hypothetical protein
MRASNKGSEAATRRQRGAGLVVIISVVAALAVSAAAIVTFTGNVQHNTSQTRMKTKSFAVCEAGLESGMAFLSGKWPVSAAGVAAFDTAAFRARFPVDEFPDPDSGAFIAVDWYDDLSPEDPDVHWDSNDNGMMWLVSQAGVGSESTRVLTLVERTWFTMALPRGIPLWAGGDLESGGVQPKIVVEVPPPEGTVTTIHVGGDITIDGVGSVTQAGIAQVLGGDISPLDEVFPQTLVDALKLTAQANGRYFTSQEEAENSPVDPVWSPWGGLSGLCVIEPPTPTTIIAAGGAVLNTEEQPGIFMVLGGSTLDWRGTAQFYGVIYVEGTADFSRGTADIHGMCVVNTDYGLRGTPDIRYNDDCISRLDERFPSATRRVPNTWREIQPQ